MLAQVKSKHTTKKAKHLNQRAIDFAMIELDGTAPKAMMGANAILAFKGHLTRRL